MKRVFFRGVRDGLLWVRRRLYDFGVLVERAEFAVGRAALWAHAASVVEGKVEP